MHLTFSNVKAKEEFGAAMTFSRAAARNRDHNVFNSCCPYLVVVTLQSCRREYNFKRGEWCVIYDVDRHVRGKSGMSSTRRFPSVIFEVRLGKKRAWRDFSIIIWIFGNFYQMYYFTYLIKFFFSSRIIELFLSYLNCVTFDFFCTTFKRIMRVLFIILSY